MSRWRPEFDRANTLTVDNPTQQARLARLRTLILQKLDEMSTTRKAYEHGTRGRELATLMLTGKDVMDEIREVIAELHAEEQGLALHRQHDRVARAELTLALYGVSFFVFLSIFIVLVMRIARQKAKRELAEQFMAILGHDLRNPLNAIMMAASSLERTPPPHGADGRRVNLILSSAARMSKMIADLLDLTRSRLGGGITIERKRITLNDIVTSIVDELRQAFPSRRIDCTLAPNVRGDWDAARLAQVVSNLVGNALQHGDPARAVEVRLVQREREVMLEVQNFGSPISPNRLSVLFEPYQRERGDTSPPGLGLGLFISHQIVLAHGGHVDVTSDRKSGTIFSVRLPLSDRTHAAALFTPALAK